MGGNISGISLGGNIGGLLGGRRSYYGKRHGDDDKVIFRKRRELTTNESTRSGRGHQFDQTFNNGAKAVNINCGPTGCFVTTGNPTRPSSFLGGLIGGFLAGHGHGYNYNSNPTRPHGGYGPYYHGGVLGQGHIHEGGYDYNHESYHGSVYEGHGGGYGYNHGHYPSPVYGGQHGHGGYRPNQPGSPGNDYTFDEYHDVIQPEDETKPEDIASAYDDITVEFK